MEGGKGRSQCRQFNNFGVLLFHCVSDCVCADVKYMCQSFVPSASEKRVFVRRTRPGEIGVGGGRGYGHRNQKEHQALYSFLFVLCSCLSHPVQWSVADQRRATSGQGALTRFDSWIEPQEVPWHVAFVVLQPRPPPLRLIVVLPTQDSDGVTLAE